MVAVSVVQLLHQWGRVQTVVCAKSNNLRVAIRCCRLGGGKQILLGVEIIYFLFVVRFTQSFVVVTVLTPRCETALTVFITIEVVHGRQST